MHDGPQVERSSSAPALEQGSRRLRHGEQEGCEQTPQKCGVTLFSRSDGQKNARLLAGKWGFSNSGHSKRKRPRRGRSRPFVLEDSSPTVGNSTCGANKCNSVERLRVRLPHNEQRRRPPRTFQERPRSLDPISDLSGLADARSARRFRSARALVRSPCKGTTADMRGSLSS